MSFAFASLLEQVGFDTDDRSFWQRVVMIHNCGMVPVERLDEEDVMATRGFNALVLGPDGVPTHFCKCRPPRQQWIRQSKLCTRLSLQPPLRHCIPETADAGSSELHMSISRYVPGRLLESRARWMRPSRMGLALDDILQSMEAVSRHGPLVAPELLLARTCVDLEAESRWAFDALPAPLLPPHRAGILREVMAAAGPVPRVPQHGDLWPRNIIEHGGRWWLLDLEMFGMIQVPLYDAFHLLRGCWALRRETSGRIEGWMRRFVNAVERPSAWIESFRSGGAGDAFQRALAAARARHALTSAQALGTLAFYLVDATARLYRRQVGQQYVNSYLQDVALLADTLATGEPLVDVFRDAA